MKQTNPKQFRAELKDYLELAAQEPIRLQRRSGDSLILMKEEHYQAMQDEILSLQRRLLGMSEALTGQVSEYQPHSQQRIGRVTPIDVRR